MMRYSPHFAAVGLLTLGVGFGAQHSAPHPTDSTAQIRAYRDWFCVTPQPIDMAPEIALSCVGPAEWDRSPKNPHVQTLYKVFVNSVGKPAMMSRTWPNFPVGTIIVKEKYQLGKPRALGDFSARALPSGAKPVLLTAMIKHGKGFDPKNGDWEYLALSGDFARRADGLRHCASCHALRKKGDYVFRGYGSLTQGGISAPFVPYSPPESHPGRAHGR